jgi:ribosome biogenesis GTPase
MDSPLALLGWDDAWASTLAEHQPEHSLPPVAVGRVSRSDRDSCDVLVAAGRGLETVTAAWGAPVQRARLADPTSAPVTGDWVVVTDAQARPAVERVLPRRSAIVRAQAGRSSHGQVLAANADIVGVVEGLAPDPDPARMERLLALAWASGGRPVVVLTKADLVADPQTKAADLAVLAPGTEVLTTSATTGAGLEPLRDWLSGGATIALLGASGVGKSTLLNALVGGGDAVMRTRSLRSDGKGRHTTVTRELHLVPGGGALLDTPGLRTVGLTGVDAIEDVFPEVEELAAGCRFADCEHRTEPGCAVLAAVEAGTLPRRRLDSYHKLLREAQHHAARSDARLRAEMTQVWKTRKREYRRRPNRKV